ncbi:MULTISPECIES: helix-hairpin-helix domain-containing protein [Aneurinibacillus]|uniref:Competence protein ComEA n=1 Tax=Aneurinibacillus thermoaerophilus TaxID=143495 RepID=A0A1G7Z7P4_ANETH|nr:MULTISPECIES: helix-hairpin-helix domain-containing protein [Aneurinibacillus]AMA72310.1 hypothetical protein ACH33_05210 [Aneurinibacillus sp. XH2]MED0674839.1 helix-hairpin-helix domain-containing protein [Aneurinibacillus thermoaerophilus]MED0679789.1 helix-hairpin-helix domain-containing protein [Aneurinibacillus thermoaerophilus]MED0735821.1 helix-hairpin-helix domain-containing protein [Aneurinibacillus thermoaerophilus]MED0758509.1 helix-hairpin-helix domain-containing protein [Aneur
MKSWFVEKKKWISISICLFILGSSIYFYNYTQEETEAKTLPFSEQQAVTGSSVFTAGENDQTGDPIEKEESARSPAPSVQATVVVDVKGAVAKPGVYTLPAEARVYQAIGMAGGLLPEADAKQVNGAQRLVDGMLLYIPIKGEEALIGTTGLASAGTASAPGAPGQEEKININTATLEQLQTIPGIGPGKAAAIIQYREENGLFRTVEDLTKVAGIGPKTLEKMRAKISVQ